MNLTKEQVTKYLTDHLCPFCGEGKMRVKMGDSNLWVCYCGAEWREIYTLTDIRLTAWPDDGNRDAKDRDPEG